MLFTAPEKAIWKLKQAQSNTGVQSEFGKKNKTKNKTHKQAQAGKQIWTWHNNLLEERSTTN